MPPARLHVCVRLTSHSKIDKPKGLRVDGLISRHRLSKCMNCSKASARIKSQPTHFSSFDFNRLTEILQQWLREIYSQVRYKCTAKESGQIPTCHSHGHSWGLQNAERRLATAAPNRQGYGAGGSRLENTERPSGRPFSIFIQSRYRFQGQWTRFRGSSVRSPRRASFISPT